MLGTGLVVLRLYNKHSSAYAPPQAFDLGGGGEKESGRPGKPDAYHRGEIQNVVRTQRWSTSTLRSLGVVRKYHWRNFHGT